ncbi:MIP/aquaporin family protein [Photobacterium phosphoreum]|uniref:MIP/aquaporin family protein n=1 Tax=Photobacterium phosphoreum TaxID=659 RepID=UPI000D170D24|nr:MIP/aquaporin family protein [Photobacterium phosphoreum]PSU83001.1 aquaporin [Photobacterium phosphoreum]
MTRSNPNALVGECFAEFIGTGLLIFFGVGCVAAMKLTGAEFSQWEISIMWGLGVAIAIYVTAGVSGAHLNPAVTIALASFHGFNKRKVLPYIMAQLLGAFASAALIYGLYGNLFHDYEASHNIVRGTVASLDTASIFSTYPNPSLSFGGAFAVEFTITAILMFTILAIADDKNGAPRGAMGPLLIGLVVALIGGSLGPLTGFAMNPARDFGPKLLTFFAGWDTIALTGGKNIPYFIVPILAPICGALFGGWAYPKLLGIYLPGNKCTLPNKCEGTAEIQNVEA